MSSELLISGIYFYWSQRLTVEFVVKNYITHDAKQKIPPELQLTKRAKKKYSDFKYIVFKDIIYNFNW